MFVTDLCSFDDSALSMAFFLEDNALKHKYCSCIICLLIVRLIFSH